MQPKVSIILLNCNGKEFTIDCLKSLQKINYKNYEVIVVDNGSDDGFVSIAKKQFPYVKLIESKKNLGFAQGNNVGAELALKNGSDYVLLLNNDTVVDRNFLKELVNTAESDKTTGITGPKMYYFDSPKKIWFAGGKLDIKRGLFDHIGYKELDSDRFSKQKEVDYMTGCTMLIKKEVIKNLGLFDPVYFAYVEDIDFCLRTRKAGYNIMFVPEAKIWHKVSSYSGGESSPFKTYFKNRNILIFMRKHADNKTKLIFSYYFIRKKLFETAVMLKKAKIRMIDALCKGIYKGLTERLDK